MAPPDSASPPIVGAALKFAFCWIAAFVVGIALIDLSGWVFEYRPYSVFSDRFRNMAPWSVVMLMLMGFGIGRSCAPTLLGPTAPTRIERVARFAAFLAALIPLIQLCEYFFNYESSRFDLFLFHDTMEAVQTRGVAGRMVPQTAIAGTLAGFAIVAMSSPRPRIMRWSLAMAIISGLISLLALVGQAFGLVPFSARPNLAGMVLQTATALLVINMGVILYHIRLGRIPVLLKRGAGGELVRRLIFAAVLIPILISILMAFGYSAGLYDLTVAIALYTVLIVVTFVTLIYRISEAVSQAEEREVLKRALRARDEFLSIASHELKTPITSLKLQTQMTKRNLLSKPEQEVLAPERMKRFVDQADRSIDRLARLVDDMLDISRIATGKLALTPVDFDLVSLVQEAADRFSILFEAGQLSLSLPPNLVIHADRLRIEQVLTNLLTNASRYGEGKAVELRLTQLDGSVVLEIQDHGRGIAIGDQDRIFQRFERAISPNEVSGMGLGLFIVREILNLHGGDIRVTSELGRGSTFIVTFPARPAAIPA